MILGITGTLGAGKGTVVEYLKSKGFEQYAVSDTFLVNEAVKRGLAPDRRARHDIANEFRAQGPTKLMEAVYEMARPAVEAGKDVFIEPQHSIDEVRYIQSLGGKVFSIDADIKIRYERIWKRASSKDQVSFEEFKSFEELEMRPTENTTNDLAGAIEVADYHLTNDGTLEELHAQIDTALHDLRK